MTISRFELLAAALSLLQTDPGQGWQYQTGISAGANQEQAFLDSLDNQGTLLVRCDFDADKTVSVQFRASSTYGMSMDKVALMLSPDNKTAKVNPISSVWESAQNAAYIRDGAEDPFASDAATTILSNPGTLIFSWTDRNGDGQQAIFPSRAGLQNIRKILADCPWHLGMKEAP